MSEPMLMMPLPSAPNQLDEMDRLRLCLALQTDARLTAEANVLAAARARAKAERDALVADLRDRYALGGDDVLDPDTGAITRKESPA